MYTTKNMRRDLKFGVAIGLGIVLLLALVEVVLRFGGFYFSTTPAYMEFNFPDRRELRQIFEPDPVTLWRMRPGMSLGEGIEPLNSRGFRGPEFRDEKPTGKIRVIALGDSVTFGARVSYPSIMAQCLGEGYEVINAGAPGFSSLQGLRLYETSLKALKADIVVVMFGWNDHWLAMGYSDAEQTTNPSPVKIEDNPLGDLRLYQLVLWGLIKATGPPAPKGPRKFRVSPEEYEQNLLALASLVNQSGARTIMATAPSALAEDKMPRYLYYKRFVDGDPDEPETEGAGKLKQLHGEYTDIVRKVASSPGRAILVDMEKQWDERGVEDLFASPENDVIHPNDDGYRLMARALCDTIRQIAFEGVDE